MSGNRCKVAVFLNRWKWLLVPRGEAVLDGYLKEYKAAGLRRRAGEAGAGGSFMAIVQTKAE
jgi:hypothetical protein